MRTESLIELLSQDASERSNFDHALRQAALTATAVTAIAFFGAIGFRPDIKAAMETGRFLFKFVITINLAVTASIVLFRIGRPGVPLRIAAYGMLLPLALMLASAVIELTVMPSGTWVTRMIGHNSRLCLTIIPSLSIGPLFCFLWVLRSGAPARPAVAGAVAGLAAAGIAATFYAANCDDDSPLFVLLWYPIAITFVTVIGGLLGNRILKW